MTPKQVHLSINRLCNLEHPTYTVLLPAGSYGMLWVDECSGPYFDVEFGPHPVTEHLQGVFSANWFCEAKHLGFCVVGSEAVTISFRNTGSTARILRAVISYELLPEFEPCPNCGSRNIHAADCTFEKRA